MSRESGRKGERERERERGYQSQQRIKIIKLILSNEHLLVVICVPQVHAQVLMLQY